MSERQGFGLESLSHRMQNLAEPGNEPRARVVGSPLPVGSTDSSRRPISAATADTARPIPSPVQDNGAMHAQPHQPALPGAPLPAGPPGQSGFERALSTLRSALPLVQRILPLLDGNIGTAVSNLLAPRPHDNAPQAPPPVQIDLEPVERGLAELRGNQRELRNQVQEQNSSLKRVEDQLERVREATDRNTLEQQELLEDLKSVGARVSLFAYVALGLLAVSVILNLLLFFHLRRVLP